MKGEIYFKMYKKSVKIIDRSKIIEELNRNLKLDVNNTAIVTIDMHRGHLDPKVATEPCKDEDCERVVKNSKDLLDFSRGKGIPIIHVVMINRIKDGVSLEAKNVKFWQSFANIQQSLALQKSSSINEHNLEGKIQTEIIPELYKESDYVINNKKRLSSFYGTDLEILLRVLGIETTVLIGVNTNTCVLCSAFESFNRDYTTIVISDCVASMYGEDLHIFGLQNISRCLGWVLTVEEFKKKIC